MPWSEWQAPLEFDNPPAALRVQANIGSRDPAEHGFVQSAISNLTLTSRVSHDDLGYTIGRFDLLQFSAPVGWDTARAWFPVPLQSMIEGVDYAARPDRNPLSDDDAYVEYEDGLNEHVGWMMPLVTVVSPMTALHASDLSPADGSATGTLELLASSYPATAGADIGAMPTGAIIYTEGMGETGSFTPSDPGFLSFSFVIATGVADIADGVRIGWGVELSQMPLQVSVSPRWRYWIPDSAGPVQPIPLRQRQRDDGLGLSTARQRARNSRQRSIRQRAYL